MSEFKLDEKALQAVAQEFLAQTKVRLKDRWDNFPQQTKDDIVFVTAFAAKLASRIAVGETGPQIAADRRVLESAVSQIKGIGAIEVRMAIEEAIDTAGSIAGTFFRKAVQAALAGALASL